MLLFYRKSFICPLFKADETDSETLSLSSSVPEVAKSGERGLCRSHHITVTRVQLRHPRSKLPSRPFSMPAERILNRSQIDENNSRNATDQDDRKGSGCDQSIEEVDETENIKTRAATHFRSTFIDTQTLRRTWDKQYKHEVASRTVKIEASSSTESAAVEANSLSTSVPSTFSLGTTYTVAVRPNRTIKREDNVTKYSPIATTFRAPRTLQPPPGTFYKPPSGSKAKVLQNCAQANSAEEEDEEEDEDEDEEGEIGIEIEVSVDEPLEEDVEIEQTAISQSPSCSPEEMDQNQAKPVYQRLRPRRLPEVEHREAHFV